MQIAIPIFDRFTALDAVGPYEVLQRLPEAVVTFVGHRRGGVRTENGFLEVTVDATFDELPSPDVVVVPGGVGTRPLVHAEPILDWIRTAHATSTFTTSVCSGALLLAAAGVLDGLTATTHWGARGELEALGAVPVPERIVAHPERRIVTAAGVSAGIDMALALAALLTDRTTAEAMQLEIEYDPQPPFGGAPGAIETAGDAVLARLRELLTVKN